MATTHRAAPSPQRRGAASPSVPSPLHRKRYATHTVGGAAAVPVPAVHALTRPPANLPPPPPLPSAQRAKARAFASRAALLPAADGIALVKSERCIRAPTSALGIALCACGYFVDLAAPSHALADVAAPLCDLLGIAPPLPPPSVRVADGDSGDTAAEQDEVVRDLVYRYISCEYSPY